MIISHRHRYLFVEVPHTGSHSIAEQLIRHYDGEPILRKHANVTQFLGQAAAEEKKYFKFATVRNPLDAAITDFEKLKGNHRGQFTDPAMLFENGGHVTKEHLREFNFIRDEQADFDAFFRKFRDRLYNNWFLVGHRHFERVLRFESLQEDFSEVLRDLHLTQVEPLPHVNRTAGKLASYVDYYTPATYAQVVRRYGPFLKKWGYELPSGWDNARIPLSSRVQFALLDMVASIAAGFITLDPDSRHVHLAKKCLDYVTARL